MIISVSTLFCSSTMPDSASRIRRWPSKWNGLVTTPTVRMPSSRAARATTGEAADLVDHLLRGGAADLGLRTRAETLGRRYAHLDDVFGPRHGQRLGIGIGDDEV